MFGYVSSRAPISVPVSHAPTLPWHCGFSKLTTLENELGGTDISCMIFFHYILGARQRAGLGYRWEKALREKALENIRRKKGTEPCGAH